VNKKIAILSTCDTKGVEASYLKELITQFGGDPIVVDVGIRNEPLGIVPDINHHQLAAGVGLTIEEIANSGTRGAAIDRMAAALKVCLKELLDKDMLCGVLCVAGSGGSILVTEAMQELPYGLPKMIASPITSGSRQFGTFMGTSDMTIMHSVVDILGINHMSRKVFANIAGAIVGMSKAYMAESEKEYPTEKCIGITMYGQTTPGVMYAKEVLEKNGYTRLVFHGNGVGGPSMERLIKEKQFVGILDYNLSEMVGNNVAGWTKCSPERLTIAGSYGIPQVILPGSVDFINIYPQETTLPEYINRKHYNHNKALPLVRTTKEENIIIAKAIARNLNASIGPVHVVLPLRGFSMINNEGGPFWNKETDDAFRAELKVNLKKNIRITEVDANINDPICGQSAAKALIELLNN
jgi:uncharacterized protein (UPF0261 family)